MAVDQFGTIDYTVKGIDPNTVQQIREMATRYRVRQATIIEEAICHVEWIWATHTGLPEGFRKPRDW